VDALGGAFLAAQIARGTLPRDWHQQIVDLLWEGIAAPGSEG
jgi:hypothetical protein